MGEPRPSHHQHPGRITEVSGQRGELHSGYDRMVVLRAHQRMASYYSARVYEDMASVNQYMQGFDESPMVAAESAAAEIRVALRLTRRAADNELGLALDLCQDLPAVWRSLASGDLDVGRARTVVDGVAHLPVETTRCVVGQVLPDAPELATGRLAACLRRGCVEADPLQADERYRHAASDPRVSMQPTAEGTANLYDFGLPPERVSAVTKRLNYLARSLKIDGETRTMDQLRCDVLLDLLQGFAVARGAGRGTVDIHVDLETLARLAESPGELAGYGPVAADVARRVAADQQDSEWRFTVVDPDSGRPIHTGVTRRRPSAAMRRSVEARNLTCVFPGCRMPSVACDLDHAVAWAEGGPTIEKNLGPVCRHDHGIKHRFGWHYEALPNGNHVWTTRLGHKYTTSCRSP